MTESLRELVQNYLLVPIAGNKWEMSYTMLIVERITHHWTCYFYCSFQLISSFQLLSCPLSVVQTKICGWEYTECTLPLVGFNLWNFNLTSGRLQVLFQEYILSLRIHFIVCSIWLDDFKDRAQPKSHLIPWGHALLLVPVFSLELWAGSSYFSRMLSLKVIVAH